MTPRHAPLISRRSAAAGSLIKLQPARTTSEIRAALSTIGHFRQPPMRPVGARFPSSPSNVREVWR
eukprot:CAMPEP_0119376978 /NCGR_PEP_ID=MMETSP1334-20130426/42390_1 /TAXON_ID=127549 /ORGANISM="Calcidiscus leptoporus, Strain RCC1130" /LENGTH=65 /DNA_ID=CAMNT_0007395723 /DNA_START=96 /DNA_END=293 /DNA_ORIENTATION=-